MGVEFVIDAITVPQTLALPTPDLGRVLDMPLERLQSDEGPALGAAVTALAALESYRRRQQDIATPFTVADGVAQLVKFREPVAPIPAWRESYQKGLQEFERIVTASPAQDRIP